jgi:hypothetical protein
MVVVYTGKCGDRPADPRQIPKQPSRSLKRRGRPSIFVTFRSRQMTSFASIGAVSGHLGGL